MNKTHLPQCNQVARKGPLCLFGSAFCGTLIALSPRSFRVAQIRASCWDDTHHCFLYLPNNTCNEPLDLIITSVPNVVGVFIHVSGVSDKRIRKHIMCMSFWCLCSSCRDWKSTSISVWWVFEMRGPTKHVFFKNSRKTRFNIILRFLVQNNTLANSVTCHQKRSQDYALIPHIFVNIGWRRIMCFIFVVLLNL